MTIGVDIDDVLAQWNISYLKYINNKFGTNFKFDQITEYDYRQCFPEFIERIDFFNLCFEFYGRPEFIDLDRVEYSEESIKRLAKKHKLYAVTARPEHLQQITENWIDKYFPNIKEIVFTNFFTKDPNQKMIPKSEVCQNLGVDLFIEDAPHHAKDIAAKGINVFLLEKPWNRNFEVENKIFRKDSWKHITKDVLNS